MGPFLQRRRFFLAFLSLTALSFVLLGNVKNPFIHRPELHPAPIVLRDVFRVVPDPVSEYPKESPTQVALLLTNSEEQPLAPIQALKSMGIPFFCTRELDRALAHPLVVIFPGIYDDTFRAAQFEHLQQYLKRGGVIFAQNVLASSLKPVFGFDEYRAARTRHRMMLSGAADPILRYLDRPEEREVQLGSPSLSEVIWTTGYAASPEATVLARFDDSSAALIANRVGEGRSYLVGADLNDVVLRSSQNRDFEAQRWYVNRLEPGADIWLLILRSWYETYSPTPVRLDTMPHGLRSMLLISHDIDWEFSVERATAFLEMERRHQVSSTFFMQTKYLNDATSRAFFYGKNLDVLRSMKLAGADFGSHSVLHSKWFDQAPLGSGKETFANYHAQNNGREIPVGITAMAEACVSKSLLDGELPGQHTTFFRAGHLRVPPSLPEALVRCGYEFDSSFTADDVLTSFPYRLDLGFDFEHQSPIYEFPLSIEDEEQPELLLRVDAAMDLIQAHADNGAPTVLLIHPNDDNHKLMAEEEILDRLPHGVIAGNLTDFAKFWRARDHVRWTVTPISSETTQVELVTSLEIDGLTLDCAKPVKSATGIPDLEIHGEKVVLPKLAAGGHFQLELHF